MDDLLTRTRPTTEGIASEWTPDAQQRVLADVLARPRRTRRRWPLAVAASVIAALMLALPVSFPGWFARSAAADELDGLARSTAGQPLLEWRDGQYLRATSTSTQTGAMEPGSEGGRCLQVASYDDYLAADGWQWSDRLVNGQVQRYLWPPSWGWHRPDYAARMPPEPHLLDAFLRARALGSTSQDEAVFVAVGDMLRAHAAPPAVRAAAIGVLALNPKVTSKRTDDPAGRPAIKVTFTDEGARPGVRQVLFLEPDTGTLLAEERTWDGGSYRSITTRHSIVDELPAELVAALGTDRVGKEVIGGVTRILDAQPPIDPLPGAEPSYTPTPTPKR